MANEKELQLDTGDDNQPKSKKLVFIIIGVVVVAIAVGVTLFLMLGSGSSTTTEDTASSDAADTEVEETIAASDGGTAMYIKLKPEFIVNFQVGPRQRYLQVYMEALTRDPEVATALEDHSPMIRSSIIRIMGEQEFEFLRTPDGRVKLQELVTEEVRRLVTQETGIENGVEKILFTNFVMQ